MRRFILAFCFLLFVFLSNASASVPQSQKTTLDVILAILFDDTEGSGSDDLIPKLVTVGDVIRWVEINLYYKNVDTWDPAPEIADILKDGYGDCKMLAGVVSVLLDSVGKKNLFIVIITKGTYHMFNAYEEDGKWRVVSNARLVKRTFSNLDEIKGYFEVSSFEKTFDSYQEFRLWFNNKFFPGS